MTSDINDHASSGQFGGVKKKQGTGRRTYINTEDASMFKKLHSRIVLVAGSKLAAAKMIGCETLTIKRAFDEDGRLTLRLAKKIHECAEDIGVA